MFTFNFQQSVPIPLNIELSIQAGELHALVGPSGSGKTTCLRAIAGLIAVQSGSVRQQNEVWLDVDTNLNLPAHCRRVGLVFQSYALFPHLSAQANVMTALDHRPKAERQAVAKEWLERVRLKGLEQRLPAELSGGQQQRVAMARALAREPDILLLDEPFAAVDQRTRQRLYRELVLLRRDLEMPILLVTHDLNEARLLADRMTVLHHGQALATATPDELINRPPSVTVARLLGQRNLFEGQIAAGPTLRWGPYQLELSHSASFQTGEAVAWTITPNSVLLHRKDRPSRGERENPMTGEVTETVALADQVYARLRVDNGQEIAFAVSAHAARRNGLAGGTQATVSLLSDGIHLMPAVDELPSDRMPRSSAIKTR